jgi:hypothetical protein
MSGDIVAVLARAKESFGELTNLPVESVSRIEPTEGGWQANFEVVELERIPHVADVLASYEVEVDPAGTLRAWRRTRRYLRKQQEDL